ncbi:thioesterase II family protein [Amycolatopsis sp. NPDC052450]|uniref:thioesterase II family protein n=1 Tax=Amycolatopsis sp. NPDC052450 TaxID=3363937 RepID=UPI0037C5D371
MTGGLLTIVCPKPVPDAELRLYLLHHAGGSHTVFRPWLALLPESWEVRLVIAPGRAKAPYPAARDITTLSDAFAVHLDEQRPAPYAMFGHSMGGLVAFDTALVLQAAGLPQPEWVGVSGHPGPFHSITRTRPPLYGLPSAELRAELIALDGLPDRVLRDEWLWQRVEPLVRADLEAAETWHPTRHGSLLTRPVSAFCGDRDPVAGITDAANWSRHTNEFLGVRPFPGGHFYFQDDPEPLVRSIVADVGTVLGRSRHALP